MTPDREARLAEIERQIYYWCSHQRDQYYDSLGPLVSGAQLKSIDDFMPPHLRWLISELQAAWQREKILRDGLGKTYAYLSPDWGAAQIAKETFEKVEEMK